MDNARSPVEILDRLGDLQDDMTAEVFTEVG
jgi:hypothetical protein